MSRRQPGGKAPPGSVYIKVGLSTGYEDAKRLGARWDKSAAGKMQALIFWPDVRPPRGCWFVPPGKDVSKFRERWQLSTDRADDGYGGAWETGPTMGAPWPDDEADDYDDDGAMQLRHGLRVKQSHSLGAGTTLYISRGGVTDFTGDALVNAADEKCVYGKGVDGAVNMGNGKRAKNQPLIQERLALPVLRTQRGRWGEEEVRCETGDAKITTGGRLAVRNVIHAVAPNCASPTPSTRTGACTDIKPVAFADRVAPYKSRGGERGHRALESAYLAAMGQARDAGVRSLAFSLLSGGYFRGSQPLSKVLEIGVEAIAHGACKHDTFERAQALAFPR